MLSIDERIMNFAVRIFHLSRYLRQAHHEYSMADQILRSGTSIGANYEEACGTITSADYIAKISISLKEARETRYWLKLFFKTELVDYKLFESLCDDCNSIINILGKTIRTAQTNNVKSKKLQTNKSS